MRRDGGNCWSRLERHVYALFLSDCGLLPAFVDPPIFGLRRLFGGSRREQAISMTTAPAIQKSSGGIEEEIIGRHRGSGATNGGPSWKLGRARGLMG